MSHHPRIFLAAVLMAGVAIGLVGCGGGESASTPATTSAALSPREKEQQALRRYLAQSKIANGFFQRGRSMAVRAGNQAADQDINSADVAAAAALFRRAAQTVSEASVRQRLVSAPRPLRTINTRFAKDMGARADYYDELGAALRAKNGAQYNAVSSSPGNSVRNEWRLEVTAACRRLGIPLPAWAKVIGTNP